VPNARAAPLSGFASAERSLAFWEDHRVATVTKVRTEVARYPRTHEHLIGVCTANGRYYTRGQVVDGINRGEKWETSAGGSTALIHEVDFCTVAPGCPARPYITTAPDHTEANNLDNLPRS
jgi:hypothetical protein